LHHYIGSTKLPDSNHPFATTQWTLVWKAASDDSHYARPALEELMRRYWLPLYSFGRRQGLSNQDAEDATQEFLSGIISGNLLDHADPSKGRFRAYLLTAWKRFLIDQYRKQHSERRGGEAVTVALNFEAGEQHWQALQSREPDPDRIFMRSWATSLLEEAKHRLRADYAQRNRQTLFDALQPWLTQSPSASDYSQLSIQLNSSASTVKVALHRLRTRFGALLREVVAETVDDPADIDREINELLQLLRY
jgi:RNA polymerase sigma factor (sigma-70 family)